MITYMAQCKPNNVPAEGEPFKMLINGHMVRLVLQYRYNRIPHNTPPVVHYASGRIIIPEGAMHSKKMVYGVMRGRAAPSDREIAKLAMRDIIAKVGEARIHAEFIAAEVINK